MTEQSFPSDDLTETTRSHLKVAFDQLRHDLCHTLEPNQNLKEKLENKNSNHMVD